MSGTADLERGVPSPRGGEGGAKRRVRAVGPPNAIPRARQLREAMTDAERRFWNLVRNRNFEGLKFVRQYPIGPFIADFACRDQMLVVEIDGSQHAHSTNDNARTAFINAEGYSVLRFWNDEVLADLTGVDGLLRAVIAGQSPSPGWRFSPATLSPAGRGDATGSITA
ncbi:MAG: endonuclease domain-containing protein [Bauldia sp.]